MKTYIGTKMINAQPMNRADYNEYRNWNLPENENGEDEGYLVEYLDGGKANDSRHAGYISWSPKAQFDAAYIEVPGAAGLAPHQLRVLAEKAELESRLTKLQSFFGSSIFAGLGSQERGRLQKQAALMAAYSEVLGERIAAF